MSDAIDLKQFIRDIPDFPVPGILYRDITPILKAPEAFEHVVGSLADKYADARIDLVVGIEARGFLFAAPLALRLGKPLVPFRKKGKLPFDTISASFTLEYGEAVVEVHTDAIEPGQTALVVDDLLATGGTLAAAASLVERAGGVVAGLAVVVELTGLEGRAQLASYDLFSLIQL
jgi:adenine phosphoribosyltransferase